jgi:putative transposase
LIDFGGQLSIRRQCELLGINRSSLYYKPVGMDAETLLLMRLIDEEYTKHPFYGMRRMCVYLQNLGHAVNRKRIRRLYELLGLEAIYPKPNLSEAIKAHAKFPYLLRGVVIDYHNQVWSTDITYIRLKCGFVYLMAIIDWFSRYVLDWELSVSLEADFCIEALSRVLSNGKCDIFNTDQGSQFTSEGFTGILLANDVKISMDGRGRAFDNIFIERLWRSVKYESVYLNQWETVKEARAGLRKYFEFYNHERPHQSLNYKTPWVVYNA